MPSTKHFFHGEEMKFYSDCVKQLLVALILFPTGSLTALNAQNPKIVMTTGTIVSVYQTIDCELGVSGIVGTIASFSSPGSGTRTFLNLTGITNNFSPSLYSNNSGDIIALWMYGDVNNVFNVACAVLPANSTTWQSTIKLSNIAGESCQSNDQRATIDQTGKILIMYTATDSTHSIIRGATYDIYAPVPTWTTDIDISNNSSEVNYWEYL